MISVAKNTKALDGILQAANKHPNSRVSKLIHSVEEERSQKNIVLLLIELAEHAEYSTDFSISLKYYLDLFEQLGLGREIVLNDAGLLLLNSSKVYARRVDFVQELVERQILTLSNADKDIVDKSAENQIKNSTEKPKRTRKRLVAAVDDPYEVELVPRKFRKLTEEKRFVGSHPHDKLNTMSSRFYRIESEQYIHPAAWIHTSIIDLENEEDIDSKRNYKLFTYHVEHRYNTLVADINFRLHFKVKDYIDEEEERLADVEEQNNVSFSDLIDWPPLSEEYVEKYLDLENRVLAIGEMGKQHKRRTLEKIFHNLDSQLTCLEKVQHRNLLNQSNNEAVQSLTRSINEDKTDSMQQESGAGSSISWNNTSNMDSCNKSNESVILERSEKEVTIISDEDLSNTNLMSQSASLNRTQNPNSTHKSILEHVNESENSINSLAISPQTKLLESNALETSNLLNQTDNSGITSITIAEQPKYDCGLSESMGEQNQTNGCGEEKSKNYNLLAMNIDLIDNSSGVLNEIQCDQKRTEMTTEQINDNDVNEINLNKIRVYLPHLDDEGVYFSDLDDQEHRMLSPRVVTTDVFPCIPNKGNITIMVDDDIRTLLNIIDDEPPPIYKIPMQIRPSTPPIDLNIFKFHEKILRRRLLFRLGPEMELFLQSRSMKRANANEQRQYRPMKLFNDSPDVTMDLVETQIHAAEIDDNILSDSEDAEDFLGFTEEEQASRIPLRLSTDSGVDADLPLASNVCSLEMLSEELNKVTQLQQTTSTDEKITDCNGENISKKNTETLIVSEDNEIIVREHISADKLPNDVDLEVNNTEANSSLNSSLKDRVDEIEICKSKIQKWHEYLQPILSKARDRHHFDVFQLGTEIMNELQKPIISKKHIAASPITFQDVMINKDESYVSRYFLSTLLLANQNNIKIGVKSKCTEKPSTWNDINLELLDTKRHTVAMEDNIGIIHSKLIGKSIAEKRNHKKACVESEMGSSGKLGTGKEVVQVNLNVVRPLKQIEKLQSTNDDYDSGIFSTEECPS